MTSSSMSLNLDDQVFSAQNNGTKPQGISHCFFTVTLDLCPSLSIGFHFYHVPAFFAHALRFEHAPPDP